MPTTTTAQIDRNIRDVVITPLGTTLAEGYRVEAAGVLLYEGSANTLEFLDGTWSVTFVVDVGSNFTPGTSPQYNYIFGGTPGNDLIIGSAGNDWIEGFGGNDYIIGLGGDDNLWGNEGDDTVVGGEGNDRLFGGAGRDTLLGGSGNDYVWADGLDTDALVDGGTGDDYIEASAAGSVISGGDGTDTIYFNFYDGDVSGTALEAETITAYFGRDAFGAASLSAARYQVYVRNDVIQVAFEEPGHLNLGWSDYNDMGATTFSVGPNIVSIDLTNWNAPTNSLFTLYANDKNNFIAGSANNEIIFAGAGDDYIATNIVFAGSGPPLYGETHGEAGNDTIVGGYNERLYGGEGNDIISGNDGSQVYGGNGRDTFVFAGSNIIIGDFQRGETLVNERLSGNVVSEPTALDPSAYWSASQADNGVSIQSGESSFLVEGDFVVSDFTASIAWVAAPFGGYLPQLRITTVNVPPTVASAIPDQAATEDAVFSITFPATAFADVDVGDALTYTAIQVDGTALPTWLSFDAASRTFSGTPTNSDVGTITVKLTATDSSNASVSDEFDIAVANVNDPPTLTASATTASVPENTTATGIIFTAVDVDNALGVASFVLSGADAEKFRVVGSGGVGDPFALMFNAAPNFEAPTDAGVNNVYDLSVAVTDGDLTSAALALSITVADVAEGPPPILGTSGNDRLTGTSGADVIEALGGNDRVNAGGGNDRIIGGAGSDTIDAGSGNDTIAATIGDGNDVYRGGSGSDTVDYSAITAPVTISLSGIAFSSETGLDRLSSMENAVGGSGDDTITGTSGSNVLSGGSGNDIINGGRGSDVIEGGLGNDRLTGGSGSDVFVFAPGFGNDVITDFDANPRGGQDRLDISAFNISAEDFATAVAIVDVGADTIVTIGGDANQTIRLVAIGDASVITAEDFIV